MYQNMNWLFFKMMGEDREILISLKQEHIIDIQICQCRMCDGELSLPNDYKVKNYGENYGQQQH